MISAADFCAMLVQAGAHAFVGVPDSLLKEFCAHLGTLPATQHLTAVNEGCAVGIAAGMHLATSAVPVIYLQNSGIGNLINPTLSLADPQVFGFPMVLLIGWRGEPDVRDEPQHVKQGRVTLALLHGMEIPVRILSQDRMGAQRDASWAISEALHQGGPTALLVRSNTFERSSSGASESESISLSLTREDAIRSVLDQFSTKTAFVSTTGMISRELYELRNARCGESSNESDFLTVGSMGHASQIALGVALERPNQSVVCLDGDGACLMHLGGLATIGTLAPRNFHHIVLNNGAHDSVGGQPTVAFKVSLTGYARASGYRFVSEPAGEANQLVEALKTIVAKVGPTFLEVRVRKGARANLGRPVQTPKENKESFVRYLSGTT